MPTDSDPPPENDHSAEDAPSILDRSQALTDPEAVPHQIGVAVALALSGRLDALVMLAASVGERASRREVLSALILDAPTDPEEISRIVRRYRIATVADALVDDAVDDAILNPTRRHGPRSRRPKPDAAKARHSRLTAGRARKASKPKPDSTDGEGADSQPS
jgi:hypothetical protein